MIQMHRICVASQIILSLKSQSIYTCNTTSWSFEIMEVYNDWGISQKSTWNKLDFIRGRVEVFRVSRGKQRTKWSEESGWIHSHVSSYVLFIFNSLFRFVSDFDIIVMFSFRYVCQFIRRCSRCKFHLKCKVLLV